MMMQARDVQRSRLCSAVQIRAPLALGVLESSAGSTGGALSDANGAHDGSSEAGSVAPCPPGTGAPASGASHLSGCTGLTTAVSGKPGGRVSWLGSPTKILVSGSVVAERASAPE